MAKKQATAETEDTKASTKEKPDAKEGKKPKEPKAKAEKPKDEKSKEEKETKGKEAKGKPTAPAETPVSGGGTSPPPATAPVAALGEPSKKRGKAPGVPPSRGKKLRAHLLSIRQRLAKEGPAPLNRAIALLKESKRSKFDETVEVHMALGIDTSQS